MPRPPCRRKPVQGKVNTMAVDFRPLTLNFDPTSGQIQRQSATALFGSAVRRADAALKGYNIRYNNGDHHLLQQEVNIIDVARNNNSATVTVEYLLRDSSGNIDDPYSGTVQVLVFADVA